LLGVELAGFEDVLQVLVYGWHADAKQLRERLLCEPRGLVLEEDAYLHGAVERRVEQELGLRSQP
jgi:hypothetical protein